MSVRAIAAAWRVECKPVPKLTLLALADHANDETFECWPSLTHLSRKTNLDRRTVMRALAELEERKVIKRKRRGRKTTVYRLNLAGSLGAGRP